MKQLTLLDSILQNNIKLEFKDCTVLTIAHRIKTILDSDRVIVIEKGKIVGIAISSILLQLFFTLFSSRLLLTL
jgi:ABC-type multidrug transport system fused ATPase/permease subunit